MNVGKFFIKGLIRVFGALPLGVHRTLSAFIAFLARSVVRYRVNVVRGNLEKAFPDKWVNERQDIEKRFYRHFGDIVTEAIWFGGSRKPSRIIKSGILRFDSLDELKRLYAEHGSVVVLYSHCGNWELLGSMPLVGKAQDPDCPMDYTNSVVVYKKLSDPVWDQVMKENRWAPVPEKNYDECYLESGSVIRYMLTHRKDRKIYFCNTDQRPYKIATGTIPVNFLGVQCRSMTAMAAIAAKFGYPVCFMSNVREGKGYTISFKTICEDASECSVEQIMQKYYDLLSEDIRRQPWNYLWTHRRWA